MNREQIKKRVIILIQSILGDEEMVIKEEYGLTNDLDLSSLEIISVVVDIEEEYKVTLTENELRRIVTVSDLIDCIRDLID